MRNKVMKQLQIKRNLQRMMAVSLCFIMVGCSNLFDKKENKNDQILKQAETAANNNQAYNVNEIPFDDLNSEQKYRYLSLKIASTNPNNINGIIHDYIELGKYGTESQRHNAINYMWNYLRSLSSYQVSQIVVPADDNVLQGWVDLLYAYKSALADLGIESHIDQVNYPVENELTPEQMNILISTVQRWSEKYPSHPVTLYLPQNMYGETNEFAESVVGKRVAFFIPQSGASKVYGDALLMGFKNALKSELLSIPVGIKVYDTSVNSIPYLLRQARADGATIVVGPLLKENVERVALTETPLPILALNQIEQPLSLTNNICYFSLSPEDEAINVAQKMAKDGFINPLLILPKSDVGVRVAEAFGKVWADLKPQSPDFYVQYFSSYDELNFLINNNKGLELEREKVAYNNDQLETSEYYEFKSKNRYKDAELIDIDAMFVYSSTEEFVLIKSLFERDQTLPHVFASSKVSQANLSRDFRLDLDGVDIVDIPLLIDPQRFKVTIPVSIKNDYFLTRLYAMGNDAYGLSSKFDQLTSSDGAPVMYGLTGVLSVDSNCSIQQKLSWMTYAKGIKESLQ